MAVRLLVEVLLEVPNINVLEHIPDVYRKI